jgi:multimeric flavodoxin WrbA
VVFEPINIHYICSDIGGVKERAMNILSLFGGPRNTGNTATILNWVEEELIDLGHHTERVVLSQYKVRGCLGCLQCEKNTHEPGCIQNDDGAAILNKITASDAVIYASPLYFWGVSAQMKAVIDRCYCLHRGICGSAGHTSFVEGQHHALIITAADPFENNAEQVLTSFQRMLVYNKAKCAGELLIHNCTTPEMLDTNIKDNALKFARQLFHDTAVPYSIFIPGGAPNWVPNVE